MTVLARAVRAEILKITTTRLWWVLAIVLVGYVGLTAAGLAASFGVGAGDMGEDLGLGVDLPGLVYSSATAIGYVFPLLYGTMAVTGELRHQTITPTFLAVPQRPVSLAAKLGVQAGLGALYGVAGFAATLLAGAVVLTAFDVDPGLGDTSTWTLVVRGVLAMALWGTVGVGVGALLRNQIAAIVVVLAFTQFVEPILRVVSALTPVTAQIGRFLPGAASDSLVGSSIFSFGGLVGSDPLAWWQGGLILLGYALVATVFGYLVSWRRDVT